MLYPSVHTSSTINNNVPTIASTDAELHCTLLMTPSVLTSNSFRRGDVLVHILDTDVGTEYENCRSESGKWITVEVLEERVVAPRVLTFEYHAVVLFV